MTVFTIDSSLWDIALLLMLLMNYVHMVCLNVRADGTYVANMTVPEEGGWRAFLIQVSYTYTAKLMWELFHPL